MSWIKLDDGWLDHPKIRAMGPVARSLWLGALSWSCEQLTDGFIPTHMLAYVGVKGDVPHAEIQACLSRLVALGAWHEHGRGDECRCCQRPDDAPLPADGEGWVIHDFIQYQRKRSVVLAERAGKKRTRDLNSKELEPVRRAVLSRDGHQCRYCLVTVIREGKGSRGPFGATWDHVDPAGDNTVENLVVSCRRCNSLKKDMTPAEAGLTLHPAPPATTPAPPATVAAQPAPAPAPAPVAKPAPKPAKRAGKRPPMKKGGRARPARPLDVVAADLAAALTTPAPRSTKRERQPKAKATGPPAKA